HLEETATTAMVLAMGVEMPPEVVDAGRQERDLDRGAATVVLVQPVLLDDAVLVDGHVVRASARDCAAREAGGTRRGAAGARWKNENRKLDNSPVRVHRTGGGRHVVAE